MWQMIVINGKHFYWNVFLNKVNTKDDKLKKEENLTNNNSQDNNGQVLQYSCILYGDEECWCCELSFERIKEILKVCYI